jgi:hypothetical protein
MSRWAGMVALACLLAGTSTAIAQTSNDPRTFGVPQGATAQAAGRPEQQSRSVQVYTVAGLPLGSRVQFDSADYREYKCSPSEQFSGYTWCQKTRQEKDRRGSLNVTYSLLHSQDGTAFYVNRFQEPAFFGSNEADAAIRQYSSKIGEKAEIKRLPRRKGFPEGTLATWGKIALEPLDSDSINILAGGKSPKVGYLVDFVGNFARSAKEGLPIYRVSGGAGFLWVASFDQRGRGTLRLTAIDPSPAYSSSPPNKTPSSNEQATRENTEAGPPSAATAQSSNPDTDLARQSAEKAKTDPEVAQLETSKRDVQVADKEIERLSAERAKLTAVIQQLESARSAAEGKAHTMESLAYGAVVVALLAIVSSIVFVNRRKAIAVEPLRVALGTKPSDTTGQSPVVEIQPASGGDSQPTKPSDSDSASLELLSKSDASTAGTIESGVSDSQSTSHSDAAEERVKLPV